LKLLTGVKAEMLAAGGVSGAEGGVWLNLEGSPEQMLKSENCFSRSHPSRLL